MIKKIHYFVIALTLSTGVAYAQVRVSGVVRDGEGPVAGASVVLKGTSTGISSGSDGSFTLSVPDANKGVLEVRLIGMTTVEYPLQGRTSGIEITLHPDATSLQDIVVLGYGNTIRANLTGSVGSISGRVLESVPVSSAAEAMIGKIAGVQVTTSDGSPGSEVNIRIRGGTSVSQSNQPLFIVDGFPANNINDIPPTEIQSIDVLKDASLTAIYGARGGNGVVIVTTKSARAGKITVSANHYTQLRRLSKKLPVMDAYEFVKIHDELASLGSGSRRTFRNQFGHPGDIELYKRYGKGNDWQEDVLGGTPLSFYHNVSVGGGSDLLRFNISLTHNDEKGVLIGTGIRKTNLLTKFSGNISPKIKFEFNPRVYFQQKDGIGTTGMSVLKALRYRPTNGLRDFGFIPTDALDPEEEKNYLYSSPSSEQIQNYRLEKVNTISNQAAVTAEILNGLSFRSEGGFTLSYTNTDRFYGPQTSTAQKNSNLPTTEVTRKEVFDYRWANTLTWVKKIDAHNISILGGQEILSSVTKTIQNTSRYFPVDIEAKSALANLGLGIPWTSTSSESAPDRSLSFFGRATYGYDNRYLFSGTFRADASTKFAPGNQWGYFPAVSAAWVISEEDFMQGQSVISFMKLRLAIGAAGNNRINDDMWRYLFGIKNTLPPGWGEPEGLPNYYANADVDPDDSKSYLSNQKIKWETTTTRNLALDLQLFDDRLSITPEVYWNTTHDLLYRVEVPSTSGYQYQMQNIGQTTNRGVELTVSGNLVSTRTFNLNFNFNIGANKTRIDKLNGFETEFYTRSKWGPTDNDYVLKVGGELGLVYGYVNDGFYTLDGFEFISGSWQPTDPNLVNCNTMFGTTPGAPKYKNLVDNYLGAEDDVNVVNEGDMTVIGNTNPDFGGGFGFDGGWKRFDFSIFFNYLYGFDVNNVNKFILSSWTEGQSSLDNLLSEYNSDRRWRYANDAGDKIHDGQSYVDEYRELNKNAKTYNPQKITRKISQSDNIEDGSFLRLQNVTVGYNLPDRLCGKIGMSRFRIYFTGYNLFTWTKYSGFDPEVKIQEGLTPGVDNDVYPRSKMYTFGVNITF